MTDLDLSKNELQNAAVQNLSTPPSNPVSGQIYYNTTDHVTYQWVSDGANSSWVPMGGDPSANAVTVEVASDSGSYLKKYVVKQNGAQVGVTIDIPKDMVVQSGSIVTGTWNNNVFTEDTTQPGTGPDKALKLIVANQTAPIYINVADLVDAYTAGTGVSISAANAISIVPAKASALGGVKIGANITVAADGTISITDNDVINALDKQNANTVLAGPTTGTADFPTFRQLTKNDIPQLGYAEAFEKFCPQLTSESGVCTWTITDSNYEQSKAICSVRDSDGNEVLCDIRYTNQAIIIKMNSEQSISAGSYKAIIHVVHY